MKKIIITIALSLVCATSLYAGQQCKGVTKKGDQCQRMAQAKSDYCYQHNPQTHHCSGVTKKGEQCKMPVKIKGDKCHIHKG